MIGIISILGMISVVPIVFGSTFLSILIFTIVNNSIPKEWYPLTNIAMVILPCISVIVAGYIYSLSVISNPIVKAILARNKADSIPPSTVISDVKKRVVVATFIVTCWHRYSGPKIITYISTQTYEIPHIDETPSLNDQVYNSQSLVQIHFQPDIIITDDGRKYLARVEQELYDSYRHRGQYCSISYRLEIPGLPYTSTLVTGKKYTLMGRRVMMFFIATVFLAPIYLIICSLKTRIVYHKVTKKLNPIYVPLSQDEIELASAPRDELKLNSERDELMLE